MSNEIQINKLIEEKFTFSKVQKHLCPKYLGKATILAD